MARVHPRPKDFSARPFAISLAELDSRAREIGIALCKPGVDYHVGISAYQGSPSYAGESGVFTVHPRCSAALCVMVAAADFNFYLFMASAGVLPLVEFSADALAGLSAGQRLNYAALRRALPLWVDPGE